MYRLAQLGQGTGGNKLALLARLQACEAGGTPPAQADAVTKHALAAHAAAAGPAAGNARTGAGMSGLMPKGGKRKNFVRINLKVRGGCMAACCRSASPGKCDIHRGALGRLQHD